MKKKLTFLFSIAILFPLLFAACQKEQEGVYNPKKKIEKIYTRSSYINSDNLVVWSVERHLSESWDWEGNNLHKITYYDEEGQCRCHALFSYQGNRLSSIILMSDNNENLVTYNYNYQNNFIYSIEEYFENEKTAVFQFTHTGKQITRITHTRYNQNKGLLHSVSPFRFLLPSLDFDNQFAPISNSKNTTKDFLGTMVYDLEWDDKNIRRITINDDDNFCCHYEYTYGDCINPFYNAFFGMYDTQSSGDNLVNYTFPSSKNNILTIHYSDNENIEIKWGYNYLHDKKKYPVAQIKYMDDYIINGTPQNIFHEEETEYEYK